jgi:hypothetical protein
LFGKNYAAKFAKAATFDKTERSDWGQGSKLLGSEKLHWVSVAYPKDLHRNA